MPKMLAVVAPSTTEDGALIFGLRELRLLDHGCDGRAIFILEVAGIWREAPVDRRLHTLVDLEQLRHEAPVPVESLRHPARALFGPVAESDRPLGGQLAMIGHFFHRLVRE